MQTRGWRAFWPELEPVKRPRYAYCLDCRAYGLRGIHLGTRRHRRATFRRPIVTHERPSFMIALRGDDPGTVRQNRAAAKRLGIFV